MRLAASHAPLKATQLRTKQECARKKRRHRLYGLGVFRRGENAPYARSVLGYLSYRTATFRSVNWELFSFLRLLLSLFDSSQPTCLIEEIGGSLRKTQTILPRPIRNFS